MKIWGENEKGERKTEENYIKNGEKALKIYLFVVKTQKCSRGGLRHKLIRRGKKESQQRGGGDRNAQYIPLRFDMPQKYKRQ